MFEGLKYSSDIDIVLSGLFKKEICGDISSAFVLPVVSHIIPFVFCRSFINLKRLCLGGG